MVHSFNNKAHWRITSFVDNLSKLIIGLYDQQLIFSDKNSIINLL